MKVRGTRMSEIQRPMPLSLVVSTSTSHQVCVRTHRSSKSEVRVVLEPGKGRDPLLQVEVSPYKIR